MQRILILAFGIVAYLVFLPTFPSLSLSSATCRPRRWKMPSRL